MDRARIPGLQPGQRHPDWQQVYRASSATNLPWHSPRLDGDLATELESLPLRKKRLLEVGCGLGAQAMEMYRLGFQVSATDFSVAAIDRAKQEYPEIRFEVDDVTKTKLRRHFDVVVDRGCFHVLEPAERVGYLKTMEKLIVPRGFLLVKLLSQEGGLADFGPHRFSLLGVHRNFQKSFEILRVRRSEFLGSTPNPPAAWLVTLRKKAML